MAQMERSVRLPGKSELERAIELLTEASEEGEMQADFMLGCLYSEY